MLEQVAVDGAGMVPVEAVERLGRAERGHLGAAGEVARLALAELDVAQLFDELGGRELTFRRMRQQREDGVAGGANADLAQPLDEIDRVSHRSLRGRGG